MPLNILDLELEVLQIILEYVLDSSTPSSQSIDLVSKYIHGAARSVFNRRKTLCLQDGVQLSLDEHKWTKDPTVLSCIRHLTISSHDYWEEGFTSAEGSYDQFLQRFEPFNHFIEQIRHLKTLTWNAGPVPHTLLETLRKHHPSARLRLFNWRRLIPSHSGLDATEKALATYPTLTHFRFSACLSKFLKNQPLEHVSSRLQGDWKAILAIISHSQSIEYAGLVDLLRLRSSTRISDCADVDDFAGQKHPPRNTTMRHLTIDGPCISFDKKTLEKLHQMIDIAGLTTLKFSRGSADVSFFETANTMMPNLDDISLNLSTIVNRPGSDQGGVRPTLMTMLAAARSFILGCKPLRCLSLWSYVDVVSLQDIVARHGPALETLELHEKQDGYCIWRCSKNRRPRSIRSTEDIRNVRDGCPRMQDLTIDLQHDLMTPNSGIGSVLSSALSELASFNPPLQRLQIYFDAGALNPPTVPGTNDDAEDGRVVGPQTFSDDIVLGKTYHESFSTEGFKGSNINKILTEYVTEIWIRVFGSKTTGDRRLDVKFGDWESRANANTILRWFKLEPHQRDDMMGNCEVTVREKKAPSEN